ACAPQGGGFISAQSGVAASAAGDPQPTSESEITVKSARAPLLCLAAFFASCATPSPTTASNAPAPGEPSLADVRAATERFMDAGVALAEGYIGAPSISATAQR